MKVFSEETRARMRESAKRRCTPEWRAEKSSAYSTPLPLDEVRRLYADGLTQVEIAERLGTTQKVLWRFMKATGITARRQVKRNQVGPANSSWKGEEIGYAGIHARCERERGKPKRCEVCGTTDPSKAYDWANVTGDYTTTAGFVRMCRSCHWKHDNKVQNLRGKRKEASPCNSGN